MKLLLCLLSSIALLIGCAQQPQRQSLPEPENPRVISHFLKALPSGMDVSWPPPISHSEPVSVVEPRLLQIQAAVIHGLAQKGYKVKQGFRYPAVAIDYNTFPSMFRPGTWDHKVTLQFKGESFLDHLGSVSATWQNYPSESIDTILLSLASLAVKAVPARQ